MKTHVALAILTVLAVSSPVQSDDDGPRYCGRYLSETLVRYCQTGATAKRSNRWMRAQILGTGYWLTPQRAVALGRGKRQEGIATECCEKSCSITELLEYCPDD